jgi:hypothetical protein
MSTLIAAFHNPDNAAKAAGALLDHGVDKDDLDILVGIAIANSWQANGAVDNDLVEKVEQGVTTTTAADAAKGARSGAGVGAALGILGGVASLFIPGYGLVLGGGALATALTSALGAVAAGAATGGVTGYLKDMGADEAISTEFDGVVRENGAILSIHLSSKGPDEITVKALLGKYGVTKVSSTSRVVI